MGVVYGMASEEAGRERRSNKVARLIDEYDLDGLGAELEEKWTAEGAERHSLRDLAEGFNLRLLRTALRDAGVGSVTGSQENVYRVLTDEEVSDADRIRVRRRLEQNDVDVETLLEDFVSYQSIRTYLQEYRDASYDVETDPVEQAESTIGPLRTRLATVSESKLEAAADADAFDLGDFDVTVDVGVICHDCSTRHDVSALLERGGCECG